MADIDNNLIGQTFSSIDYGQVIGAPLKAMSDNAIALCEATAEYIKRVGFAKNADGVEEAIMTQFARTHQHADGTTTKDIYELPFITYVPIPNIQLDSGTVMLDVEVSQSASMNEKIDAGGEAEGKIGWGPFSLSVKAKASYSKENTRKTDTRAKQHIELNYRQAGLPEGLELILETLRNSAVDPSSDKNQLPPPQKGATPLPKPAPTPDKKPEKA